MLSKDVVFSCQAFFGKVKWQSSCGYEKIPEIFYATAAVASSQQLLYYFHQLTMIQEGGVFGAVKSRKIRKLLLW